MSRPVINTVKAFVVVSCLVALAGCGTTYVIPQASALHEREASRTFAEVRTQPWQQPLSNHAAEARFKRVAARIRPVGESVCKQETVGQGFNCRVHIAIDRRMKQRNAYFTYDGMQPIIRMSLPLLRDTRNDDEVAFVLAHEYGHLLGKHIEKQRSQALLGALIVAGLTAAITSSGGNYDENAVNQGAEIGAAAGKMAYSKEFELESDMLGARIAHAAGYDAVKGARFFARQEDTRDATGNLSFWGTHPPDKQRLATVMATVAEIERDVQLRRANN